MELMQKIYSNSMKRHPPHHQARPANHPVPTAIAITTPIVTKETAAPQAIIQAIRLVQQATQPTKPPTPMKIIGLHQPSLAIMQKMVSLES